MSFPRLCLCRRHGEFSCLGKTGKLRARGVETTLGRRYHLGKVRAPSRRVMRHVVISSQSWKDRVIRWCHAKDGFVPENSWKGLRTSRRLYRRRPRTIERRFGKVNRSLAMGRYGRYNRKFILGWHSVFAKQRLILRTRFSLALMNIKYIVLSLFSPSNTCSHLSLFFDENPSSSQTDAPPLHFNLHLTLDWARERVCRLCARNELYFRRSIFFFDESVCFFVIIIEKNFTSAHQTYCVFHVIK